MNSFVLPAAAVLALSGASLMAMQPVFSLFGRAYSVAVDVAVPAAEPTATPATARPATPTPTMTATPLVAFAVREAQPTSTAPKPDGTESATVGRTATPRTRPVTTATHAPTRPQTSTATASASPASAPSATPSPTATPCPYRDLVLAFDPPEQRLVLGASGSKVRVLLRNDGKLQADALLLRLTVVRGAVAVAELRLGADALKPNANGAPLDYHLPPLAPGDGHEVVVVLASTPANGARAVAVVDAELRFEVLAPSCTRSTPEMRAKGSIVLAQPVKPAAATPAAIDAVEKVENVDSLDPTPASKPILR